MTILIRNSVLAVAFFSQLCFGSHCTSAIKFLIGVMGMHNVSQVSNSDVRAATPIPTFLLKDVEGNRGDLRRIGGGGYNDAFHIRIRHPLSPLAPVEGEVVRLAKEDILLLIENSSAFNRINTRCTMLGIAAAKILNGIRPQSAAETLRILIDEEGRLVGDVLTYIEYPKLSTASIQDREAILADMLETFVVFWEKPIEDSGVYGLAAHGDPHLGNFYGQRVGNEIQWMTSDMGAIPNRVLTDTNRLRFNPTRDREIFYGRALAFDYTIENGQLPSWMNSIDLEKLMKEIPNFRTWASRVRAEPTVKFQPYTIDSNTQKMPSDQIFRIASRPLEIAPMVRSWAASLRRAAALSPPQTETQRILNEIAEGLESFNPNVYGTAERAAIKTLVDRLSLFARVEGNQLVICFNPR